VRAYILAFVLKQWSIVDMGTSAQQSKLFFRLQAEYGRLATQLGDADESITERLARRFEVSEGRVRFALARLGQRDASLDAPLRRESETRFVDLLRDDSPSQMQRAQSQQSVRLVQRAVSKVWPRLSARQQRIVRERLLAGDESKSLAELGRSMGITRERVRQIESSIKTVLREELLALDSQLTAA
jgi:RNA polymerase sigma-32 factor